MESTLPPDPYKALGLSKEVDSATIKSTYRKLVLKCHPDKVTDESLKKQKQEEFHKIQQAYELIGDENARGRYDAEVKLDTLRKEKAARASTSAAQDSRAATYTTRTQAPSGATFTSTGPRYEEHKPSRPYDDRYYDERSRSKYNTYDSYPKGSSRSPREKESPIKGTRVPTDRTRSEYKKSRDKERDRDRKHVASERERDSDPSGDEKARYEAEYNRRSDDARRYAEEEEARKQFADARRKAEQRRAHEDAKYDRRQKLSDQASDAVRYIHRSKVGAAVDTERPLPSRTSSSRDARPEYYDSRDARSRRPETVRRSSARPKDRERDRKDIEIVDWEVDRKIPSFKHSSSAPPEIPTPRATPHRSYTESSRDSRRTETSPPPIIRRSSEAVSSVPHVSSSRRKDATLPRSSGLRESVTPIGSPSNNTEAYATIPPPTTKRNYYYPTPGGGINLDTEDVGVANGHRTVLREPERTRHRSPSPLTRPPIGPNRNVETVSTSHSSAVPKVPGAPPLLGRAATINVGDIRGSDERGRGRLYGEINSDHLRRENTRRQTSFSPDQVSYSQKFRPEDIKYGAPREREALGRDKDAYAKPSLGRHATYVY